MSLEDPSLPRAGVLAALASLFASSSTLVCCALPALLVGLGAGAALASLVSAVPQLVWLSEHKAGLFLAAGLMLALNAALQWRQRTAPCPVDPARRRHCERARSASRRMLAASALLYAVGAWFAFAQPALAD